MSRKWLKDLHYKDISDESELGQSYSMTTTTRLFESADAKVMYSFANLDATKKDLNFK